MTSLAEPRKKCSAVAFGSPPALATIAFDALVACAIHARKKGSLDKLGWKCFKWLAKKTGEFFTKANKAKIRQCNRKPKFKCGVEVLGDCDHALQLDRDNGNTLWQDATDLEMKINEQVRGLCGWWQ